MKRRKFLLRLSTIGALPFISHRLFAVPKDTRIYVIVDTANINAGNVSKMIKISDNHSGVTNPGSPNTFLSPIDLDKWVVWEGQIADPVNNPNDQVLITKIIKKEQDGGASLLKKDEYKGSPTVKAKVHKKYITGDMSYDIEFTVIRNSVSTEYKVDPKLRMRPPR